MNAYFFHVFLFLTTNVFTFSVYFFFHVSAHFSRVSSLLLYLFVHCLFFFLLMFIIFSSLFSLSSCLCLSDQFNRMCYALRPSSSTEQNQKKETIQ